MHTLLAMPSQATANYSQRLPTGLDIGNGSTKAIVGLHQVRIPSYVQPIHGNLHDAPSTGYVEYLEGDRLGLKGQSWLAGKAAYQRNPEGYLKVVDDRQGKLNYALQLLLGTLAHLPYKPVWEIAIVASIHHAKAMGEQLADKLNGVHVVRFNGWASTSRVVVRIVKVLDEGAGVVAQQGLTTGQTLVYDFGNGTNTISVFGDKGKLIDRQVSPGGVQSLIDAIAKQNVIIQKLAAEGDREIIRQGIEARSLTYGIQGAWSFETVYRAELKPWISTVLKSALKAGEKWTPTSERVIAIGGGAQLPLVRDVLISQGIQPLEQACWVNVQGLHKLALLMGGDSR